MHGNHWKKGCPRPQQVRCIHNSELRTVNVYSFLNNPTFTLRCIVGHDQRATLCSFVLPRQSFVCYVLLLRYALHSQRFTAEKFGIGSFSGNSRYYSNDNQHRLSFLRIAISIYFNYIKRHVFRERRHRSGYAWSALTNSSLEASAFFTAGTSSRRPCHLRARIETQFNTR
jgi:hypothetical protein